MRMTARPTLILSLAAALGLATVPARAPADEPKGDLARLQGTWSAKVGPNKDIAITLVLKDDDAEVTVARPDGDGIKVKGKLKLNGQASPKTLDWTGFTGPQGNEIPDNLAIYKLEGDAWTICSGGPGNARPAKFESGEGGPPMLNTWTRVKPRADEKPPADLARFQGEWTGKAGDATIHMTIKGNAITARWGRGDGTEVELKGEMRLNDQASPRTVDFVAFKKSDGEEVKDHLGIYAFDGETVKICSCDAETGRPTEFKAGEGGSPTLFVLSRKKD